MPTETYAGGIGEARAASTAGSGTALTTTAVCIAVPSATRLLTLTPRNLTTAAVAQYAINPYLVVLKTADLLATATDYSEAAQDGDATTDVVLSSLDTIANGDCLYVGSHLPFRGVSIDVDAANGTASVLTVKYRKSDNTWADISATDGTASGGATMAIDGSVTWTVPSDWVKCALRKIGETTARIAYSGNDLYWTRWQVSAALDSSTTLNSLMALNRSTAYAELLAGQVREIAFGKGPEGHGCIEALVPAGGGNLVVNVDTRGGGRF